MNEKKMEEILEEAAAKIVPEAHFTAHLEKQLRDAHKPKERFVMFKTKNLVSTLGLIGAAVLLLLALNWAFRSLAPKTIPGAGKTPIPIQSLENSPTPTPPNIKSYNWNGTKLYLNAPLPEAPAEANIFVLQPEHITGSIEDVQKLAKQFGLQGKIYNALGELPGNYNLLVVDGKQRLNVRSDQYFTYYPDYVESNSGNTTMDNPNSRALIDEFMKMHGFDFPYQIEPSELYGGYYAQPLTSDGFALHHEYFKSNGLLFKFNDTGIVSVEASLLKYSNIFHPYTIRSAKEAFQKLLDPNATAGSLMGMHSSSKSTRTWVRVRPKDQTITVYGFLGAYTSIDGGAPLVTLDGYTVTGNPPDISNFLGTNSLSYTFVKATGQFHAQNNMDVFEIESWKPYSGQEEGLQGTIQREDEQVVINTIEGKKLILPDMPSDVPLPLENAYIMGVTQGDTFEWKSFDTRMAQGRGGGGGGGGLGFYKLNLTGTPVPLPTFEPTPQSTGGGGGGSGGNAITYAVQAGDTLSKIAADNGVSVDALMQANSLNDSNIYVGQAFVIPGTAQPAPFNIGQKIENTRGFVSVTIYKKPDGSQRALYAFSTNSPNFPYGTYILLEGDSLQDLQNHNNRPINIWGTIDRIDNGQVIIKVERYEVPFPDLQFQILKGTQKLAAVNGQQVALFTAENDTTYAQVFTDGLPDISLIGREGDQVVMETLAVPDETFGGYPAIHIFSSGMAISPKNGLPVEIRIMADKPLVMDEPPPPTTMTVEKVELVYYVPDPRYLPVDPNSGFHPAYIEPAWRFYGHYSNGDEFEILIQALMDEFLLPELAPYTQPG